MEVPKNGTTTSKKRTINEVENVSSIECPFTKLAKKQKLGEEGNLVANISAAVVDNKVSISSNPFSGIANCGDITLESKIEAKTPPDLVEKNELKEFVESRNFDDINDEFDIIDDMLEADIDEMLEKERGEYQVYKKTILKHQPKDLFNILPNNWIEVTHDNGLIVYLHKSTRVCTFSRPYFIGQGSIRHHKVPPSAIPCYYQKKLVEEENEVNVKAQKEKQELIHEAKRSSDNTIFMNEEITAAVPMLVKLKDSEKVARGDLSAEDLHKYAAKTFEFKPIKYRRYKEWKKARKHFKDIKKLNANKANLLMNLERPILPSDTKLITVPSLEEAKTKTTHEFCLNPQGKTAVAILNDYAQKVFKFPIDYETFNFTDPINPYQAAAKIKINPISSPIIFNSSFRERLDIIQEEYKIRSQFVEGKEKEVEKLKDIVILGRGNGKSIKKAKNNAAVSALNLLIPDIKFDNDGIGSYKT